MHSIQNFIKSPVAIILLTLLTFISAFLLDFLEERIGVVDVIIGGISTLFITIIAMLLFAIFSRIQIKEDYDERYKVLEAFIKAQGLGAIISEQAVVEIEKNADSIWVFTYNMSNDIGVKDAKLQENKIVDVVSKNLKDGKQYTYFVPDSTKIHGAIKRFKEINKDYMKQVTFCMIPEKEFHFISEVVVYNADTDKIDQAIQWFPNNNMNYFIKLDENHTLHISGIGTKLLNEYSDNIT